jgi:hypothetical protein
VNRWSDFSFSFYSFLKLRREEAKEIKSGRIIGREVFLDVPFFIYFPSNRKATPKKERKVLLVYYFVARIDIEEEIRMRKRCASRVSNFVVINIDSIIKYITKFSYCNYYLLLSRISVYLNLCLHYQLPS